MVDNHNTGIKNKNLNAAQRKADEVKEIAQRNINKMSKNMDDTALLLENSQHINEMAKDFEKDANEMN